MGRYKKIKHIGGSPGISPESQGVDIKDIASFNPSTIPDLVLWIKANSANLKYEEIAAYSERQLPLIRLELLQTFGSRMNEKVITEIISDTPGKPNSLIRLEFQETMSTRFPTLYLGSIDLSNYVDPSTGKEQILKLITKEPLILQPNFSFFQISQGIALKYFESMNNLIISANQMVTAPTTTTGADGKSTRLPTALLQELIVFSRKVTQQEQQSVEGYLSYQNNTQYNLPNYHPYLPDMTTDPILANPCGQLNDLEKAIKAILLKQGNSLEEYLVKVGPDDLSNQDAKIRGILVEDLSDISSLRAMLSRGFLYARRFSPEITLASIYDGINALSLYTVPMSPDQMKAEMARIQKNIQTGLDYIGNLSNADGQVETNNFIKNENIIANAQRDAETEEGLYGIQYQVKRREFIQAQRFIQREINNLGERLLGVFYDKFSKELDHIEEAFEYSSGNRIKKLRPFMDNFTQVQRSIRSGAWAKEYSHFTVTDFDGTTYKDPTMNQLYKKFLAIEDEFTKGDIQYLNDRLERMAKGAIGLIEHWRPKRMYALLKNLYIVHLQEEFYQYEQLEHDFTEILERLTGVLTTFTEELAHYKQYQTVLITEARLGIRYYLPLPIIYFSELLPADSAVLKFTHILTDEAGKVIQTANPSGELDLKFFQPDLYVWQPHPTETATYITKTVYTDMSGQNINQVYKTVPPLQKSILNMLPISRLPTPYEKTLDGGPFELPRQVVNHIIQLQTITIQEPVFLPKYAVKNESFYFIQNVGKFQFCVRNPGALDDVVDCLGPGEIGVYLYGEGTSLSSVPGFAYGKMEWVSGMLPYDTITDCPRSSIGTFVPELNTIIYLSPENPKMPLLDKEGYYVKVQKAADGSIYDPDDFSKSNPYSVRILPDTPLGELQAGPQGRVRVVTNEVGIIKEYTTGVAILCSTEGIPSVDEFGTCKIAATHLLYVDNIVKIKGALDDIIVKGFVKDRYLRQIYNFEMELNFDELFRSRFCRPMTVGSDTSPIFVTSHGLPLCGPLGQYIFLPGTAEQKQTLLTYMDLNGTKQAFLIKTDEPLPQGDAEQIPYINLSEKIPQMLGVLKAKHILYRYTSSVEYIRSLLTSIDEDSTTIQNLGEKIVSSFQDSLTQTRSMIYDKLQLFSEIQGITDGIRKAVELDSIPNDIQISIGILDLKLRDKLQDINDLYNPVQDTLEFYKGLVRKKVDLKAFISRLQTDAADLFQKGYATLNLINSLNIQENKTISSPEVDTIKVQLKQTQDEYGAVQEGLQRQIETQPEYTSEVREWILDLQTDTAKQFNRLEVVRRLVTIRLAHDLVSAEGKDAANAVNELKSLQSDIKVQKQDFAKYETLFDLSESSGSPVKQDPLEARTQKGPFVYLTNPSLKRDIRPLEAIVTTDDLKLRWADLLANFDILQRNIKIVQASLAATTLYVPPFEAPKETLLNAVKEGRVIVEDHATLIRDFKNSCTDVFSVLETLLEDTARTYRDSLRAALTDLEAKAKTVGEVRITIETLLSAKGAQEPLDAVDPAEPADIVFKVRAQVDPIIASTSATILFPFTLVDMVTPVNRLHNIQAKLESVYNSGTV
jgi:hypothetical protein